MDSQNSRNLMSHPFHKIITAYQLSRQQWSALVKSWILMLYIRLRMDLTPFKSWKKWLIGESFNEHKVLSREDHSLITNTRKMVTLASRYHIVKANCLPKSLSLKWLLAQQGIQSELKMGLSLDNSKFQGHAWLCHGESVLNDHIDVAKQYPIKQELKDGPIIS